MKTKKLSRTLKRRLYLLAASELFTQTTIDGGLPFCCCAILNASFISYSDRGIAIEVRNELIANLFTWFSPGEDVSFIWNVNPGDDDEARILALLLLRELA